MTENKSRFKISSKIIFSTFRRVILLLIIHLTLLHPAFSQDNSNEQKQQRIKLLVAKLTDNFRKVKTDTAFVKRPETNWLLLPKANFSGNDLHFRTNHNDIQTKYILQSSLTNTYGMSVNYKGLALGFSINPKWFKKTSDIEYNFNFYNNRFGIDCALYNITEFKGHIAPNRANSLKISEICLRSMSINAYYIFNNKRFSYPAAFTHSWIQKHSAGSFLIAASYYRGLIDNDFDYTGIANSNDKIMTELDMQHVALGCGYAYNFVPNQHWLIHASIQPSLIIWKKYNTEYTDINDKTLHEYRNMPTRFPELFQVSRVSISYSFKKYFIGLHTVIQYSDAGTKSISIGNLVWKGSVYVGFRL